VKEGGLELETQRGSRTLKVRRDLVPYTNRADAEDRQLTSLERFGKHDVEGALEASPRQDY